MQDEAPQPSEAPETRQERNPKGLDLGIFARRTNRPPVSSTEVIAAVLSGLWLLGTTLFFVFATKRMDGAEGGAAATRFVMTIIAIFMPVALIWVAALAARSYRNMREESERLQSAINAMRHTYIQQQQSGVVSVNPDLERRLEEVAAAQRKTDAALATFASVRPAASEQTTPQKAALAQPSTATEQPTLALATPGEALNPPLSVTDFISALNFPKTATDKEGFRALRRALQDRNAAQLVQSAQDILTLLSQDGIYMDDLPPEKAPVEMWRRFARQERGKELAVLGGIRDRSSLALAAGRMRQDTIFRDSVHHFLRKFDHTFTQFEKTASDQEIADLMDTRSARAFMLLGRVAGTFT